MCTTLVETMNSEQNFGNEKSCICQLSMSFTTSDAETHVCAVAACGEIWFGNSTKVNIQGTTGERWYNLQKCQYFMSIFYDNHFKQTKLNSVFFNYC